MSEHKMCPRCRHTSIDKDEDMCLTCRYPPVQQVGPDVRPRCVSCDRVLNRHQDLHCEDCV